MKITVLDDGDIRAYQLACRHQSEYDFGEGKQIATDMDAAIEELHQDIEDLKAELFADEVIICLSDDYENFRKKVLPTYKSNRKGTERPELLYPLKDYMFENFRSYRKDTLEADDVMGILSTGKFIKGRKIICSADKDMQTIPGYLYNPNHPELKVQQIGEHQANYFWMYQTLIGDTTDGYTGCPGIGPVKAEKALEGLVHLEDQWEAVVEVYEAKGYTKEDALVQARCARILRNEDWDKTEKRVKLWEPEHLTVTTA